MRERESDTGTTFSFKRQRGCKEKGSSLLRAYLLLNDCQRGFCNLIDERNGISQYILLVSKFVFPFI
jgi:hypothetical protein